MEYRNGFNPEQEVKEGVKEEVKYEGWEESGKDSRQSLKPE